MKYKMLLLIFLVFPVITLAQKKEIATAREYVKKNTNLEKAEQMMRSLLTDSSNRYNDKIWGTLFDAQRKQYENGNEKLYLKQKYDTASIFNITSRMFRDMLSYDSLRNLSNPKVSAVREWRKSHGQLLNMIRPNLLNGGLFFIRKQKYETAYQLLDQYIETANQPLFEAFHYREKDRHLPEAAYWAVYASYKLGNGKQTLHHTYLALKDTTHYNQMLQLLAQTYLGEGDTVRYVNTLKEGFERNHLDVFFFSHLIDFYSAKNDWQQALEMTNQALKTDKKNQLFRMTKSIILLNTGKYQECFSICDTLIHESDTLAEAWLNAGLALFNQGVAIDKNAVLSAKKHAQVVSFYKQAMPYLEKYRQLQPQRKDRWALPLYTIYLNLNKGKEFDEIDKLLKK